MKPFILFMLSSLVIGQLSSQILRINKESVVADSSGFWVGGVSLNFSANDRNSTADQQITFVALRSRADFGYVSELHFHYLMGDARYFRSTGGPLQSTGHVHLRTNLMRKNILSYEFFAQRQYDQGRNMDDRLLGGGGLRLRITDKLYFGTGVMQEYERWESLEDSDLMTEKNLTKSTSYLSGTIDITPSVELDLIGYFQTGHDSEIDAFRNRFSLSSGLSIEMAKGFDFSVVFDLSYDARPIIPISKRVYSLTNGVKYSF